MNQRQAGHVLFRYALAVAAVAGAAAGTHWLKGLGDYGVSPLFFAAVLLSAWYGGLGPGLLATLLSGIASAHFLSTPKPLSLATLHEHLGRLIVFTVVSILTGSLHSAMRRAAEAAQRARDAAESASAAKSRFLAMVSHELRTPLSPVLMVAEMLEHDPALPPKMLPDIRTIRRHVDLEIRLIEDLVDLTRINTGKLRLRDEPVDLHIPLQAAMDVCAGDMRDKDLKLTTRLNANPSHIIGDSVRLQQIFWNLFRNAIKFTPSGGEISVITANTPAGHVSVEIADTGIGIDPQQLSRIFEAFEQGEPDIQVRFGGLGLGLAICQALVAAHHGSISAASQGRGRGATFRITLPISKPTTLEMPTDAGSCGQVSDTKVC